MSQRRASILSVVIVPIIVAIIATAPFLANLIQSYNKPNVNIWISPDVGDNRKAIIRITNNGAASATNLTLTVDTPKEILSATEKLATVRTQPLESNQTTVKLFIPQLIHGDGSIVEIETLIDANQSATYNYIAYATYDQGSTKQSILLQKLSYYNIFNDFMLYLTIPYFVAYPLLLIFLFKYYAPRRRIKAAAIKITEEMVLLRRELMTNIQSDKIFSTDWKIRLSYRVLFSSVKTRYTVEETVKKYTRNLNDRLIIEDFYAKLYARNQRLEKNDVDTDRLKEINDDCLKTADNALKIIDWRKLYEIH